MELHDAILNSAISAFDEYYAITDKDCWVEHTPEYWYTTKISIGINKLTDFVPILETPVKEFREHANAKVGRPSKANRITGKADITLWLNQEDWIPEAIVEVKKSWGWAKNTLGEDIDRICASLKETKKIESGYLIVMTDAGGTNEDAAKGVIESLKAKLETDIQSHLSNTYNDVSMKSYKLKFATYCKEDKAIAAALLFEFSQKE